MADPLSSVLVPGLNCSARPFGDSDQATPPERAHEFAAGISGARLVEMADCGPLSTMERPDVVNRHLTEWLKQAVV
jgi:pimeloyl-ACP methyl ester carboxylesterase